ncbi:tRNA (guanine10-N2)-methyltransferase [Fistulifera solaris]|uniref:tRNA (guanine(10)-N(2))-methyltransferase n=1 Tax=Fistulifera solaris TaxID=1519565 RepID=A0A1Z5KIU2_FISSO|nr:tRNA (guanine10-N2)-methyltransferase [Fistulifera solaris]|eukprot:GAX26055.1 tRNA (guanine10-N2)-methyltransferase [Fistulifera solaris]
MSDQTDTTPRQPDSNGDRYHLLIEFAHKHLDFQIAELESVLDMHGISLGDDEECRIIALPNANKTKLKTRHGKTVQVHRVKDSGSGAVTSRRPFLILSLPRTSKWIPNNDETQTNNIASIILERCTLVRNVMELWGMGTSIEECAMAAKDWIQNYTLGKLTFSRVSSESWKLTVHTLGAKYTYEEQGVMRSHVSHLGFSGPVQMKDPTNEYVLIHEIELNETGSPLYPRHSPEGKIISENDARPPIACYFARTLCGTRQHKGRGKEQYSLKNRTYLGPTSMDAELSSIMTNLGHCKEGTIAFDPFVGTGSILLSCALRGAFCIGTDIDFRILKGRSKDENIESNFRQFNLPKPELIRSDNSIHHRHFRTTSPMYDAIICDPPYGIRAGARKSGSRLTNPKPVPEDQRHDHIAQTRPYPVSDVMADLLDVAARNLVLGGRLVYIIPSYADFDDECDLPRHECLRIVHICYQPLGSELGRRMVTMEKIGEYDVSKRETHYLVSTWVNGPESAEKCANIREKILENAKLKPGYESKLEIRKQKRKANKEAKRIAKRAAADNFTD